MCVAGAFAIAGSRAGSESPSRSNLNAAIPSAHPHASSHLPLDEITASSWYERHLLPLPLPLHALPPLSHLRIAKMSRC